MVVQQKGVSMEEDLRKSQLDSARLRETIKVLRQEIESLQHDNEHNIQKIHVNNADEIRQLKDTIVCLRDSLENIQFEKNSEAQAAAQVFSDEM